MNKNIKISLAISLFSHIIFIIIFSLFIDLPSFNTKIEFEPLTLDLSSNNINQNSSSSPESNLYYPQSETKQNFNKIDLQKSEENKENKIDSRIITEKTQSTENQDKKEEIIEDSKNSSSSENTDNFNDEENSESDELVQQLISSNIGQGSDQNSKENIQWNSGANRWVVKKVKPSLPKKYQEKGNSITCKIYIEINKFGAVVSAVIIQSTGFIELDQYLISIILDWKFNQVTYDKIDTGYITLLFVFS